MDCFYIAFFYSYDHSKRFTMYASHSPIHTFTHQWQRLPTCLTGAIWGSVYCSRSLWWGQAEQGSNLQLSDQHFYYLHHHGHSYQIMISKVKWDEHIFAHRKAPLQTVGKVVCFSSVKRPLCDTTSYNDDSISVETGQHYGPHFFQFLSPNISPCVIRVR